QHAAGQAKGGTVHVVDPGEGSGVRPGSATSGLRAAALEHDDRLARGGAPGDVDESPPITQRLHEAGDQRRVRVVGEIVDHFGDVDVGLVADGEEARHPETSAGQLAHDQTAVGATLA